MPTTQTVIADPRTQLLDAVALLRAGDVVAFPTETVYGLGADARSSTAIRKIYDAKGRPSTNPLIVHLPDAAMAEQFADWSPLATRLADQFWPGPLTMVLPRRAGSPIPLEVSAGRPTIALRVPHHPVAEALLGAFNGPIAAPSANRSGFTSPTTAAHVIAELDGRIPMVLDGGPCAVGLESTVIDLSSIPPKILRPGAITAEMLLPFTGLLTTFHGSIDPTLPQSSPGQLAQHYAPHTPARRFTRDIWHAVQDRATSIAPVVLLTIDPAFHLAPPHHTLLLPEDPATLAHVLYAALRDADALAAREIWILDPQRDDGLWAAITDRLSRAAVPWKES
jgi:L-threonylcarbamoyladenylate synthase